MNKEALAALAESIELLGKGIEKYGTAIRLSLARERPAEESKARCPHCGSPERVDLSGMGEAEYQCKDCGINYASADAQIPQ